jgi:hypothetical protein
VMVLLGCGSGGGASDPNETRNAPITSETGGETAPAEAPIAVAETPEAQPVSPECERYLARYAACEPVLHAEIMGGDRRFPEAEAHWVRDLESSAEGPSMPAWCRDAEAALPASCP